MPALRNISNVGTGYWMINYYVGTKSTDGGRVIISYQISNF